MNRAVLSQATSRSDVPHSFDSAPRPPPPCSVAPLPLAQGLKITAVEGEVGLIFGEALPSRPEPYTAVEVWAAVSGGALCIEVCRTSFTEDWIPNAHQA